MKIIIRKLKDMEHNYFAYLQGLTGKGTYILNFEDDIYGAICLHNFIDMLKLYLKADKTEVCIQDKEIEIKSEAILEVIKNGRIEDVRGRNTKDINKI